MQRLKYEDIEAIAIGAAIMGTGGGGNPYIGMLRCQQELKRGRTVDIITLDELDDDAVVVAVGGVGAPVVSSEKLRQGEECLRAVRAIEDVTGCKVDALVPFEMGGSNSIVPLIVGAQAGLPVIDADGMGRAFPEMDMCTFSIYGESTTPVAFADDKGNVVVVKQAITEKTIERLGRAAVVAMGGASGYAIAPMTGAFIKKNSLPATMTRAKVLGYAVMEANRANSDPIAAVCACEDAKRYFTGKVTDLERRIEGGFAKGHLTIEGFDQYQGQVVRIDIQNEFLVLTRDGNVEITVPDLIVVLDQYTGHAITTEELRFGQRCVVLGMPADDLLKTRRALEVIGPKAFGYTTLEFNPMGSAVEPQSKSIVG